MEIIIIGIICCVIAGIIWLALHFPRRSHLTPTIADTVKAVPEKLSKTELEARKQGQSLYIGQDAQTKQPVYATETEMKSNLLINGPNGVGKTELIKNFVQQRIKQINDAVVIFEAKGSPSFVGSIEHFCKQCGRDFVVFPFHKGGYNPLALGKNVYESASIFNFALELSKEGQSVDASHWLGEQKKFVTNMMALFALKFPTRKMRLVDLQALCTDKELRKEFVESLPLCAERLRYERAFKSYRPDDLNNALQGLGGYIENLYHSLGIEGRATLYNKEDCETLTQAIKAKKVILIKEGGPIGSPERDTAMIFFAELIQYVRNRPQDDTHKIHLFLDEVQFFLYKGYGNFLSTSREHGVTQTLSVQSLGSLYEFGDSLANLIMTVCRNWIVFNHKNPFDCEKISERIGTRPHYVYSENKGMDAGLNDGSRGTQLQDLPLISPYQIQTLAENKIIFDSIKGRESAATRFVLLPDPVDNDEFWYDFPSYPSQPPLSIWDEISLKNQNNNPKQQNPQHAPAPKHNKRNNVKLPNIKKI